MDDLYYHYYGEVCIFRVFFNDEHAHRYVIRPAPFPTIVGFPTISLSVRKSDPNTSFLWVLNEKIEGSDCRRIGLRPVNP